MTSGSSMYIPVFARSLNISDSMGFSRNLYILPLESVMATPYSVGTLTLLSTIVTAAPRALWKHIASVRSASVMASPLMTMVRRASAPTALRTLPAVPRGASSIE